LYPQAHLQKLIDQGKILEACVTELTTKEINTRIAKAIRPKNLMFDQDGFPMIHNPHFNEYFDLNYCGD
jgi:hypothetical protein